MTEHSAPPEAPGRAPADDPRLLNSVTLTMFLVSFALVLFELLLTRLFAVVLFASLAHLALALALLGIGVGSVMPYAFPRLLPSHDFERRLGWVCVAQGLSSAVAVICALALPLMQAPAGSKPGAAANELNLATFALLLPILMVPFALVGFTLASTFQRYKARIGRVYAADLAGGGAAAVLFIPLLYVLSVPDVTLVVLACAAAGAATLWNASGWLTARRSLVVATVVMVAFLAVDPAGLLQVRYFYNNDPDRIVEVQWTPLTRLALYKAAHNDIVILDSGSSSEVIVTREHALRKRPQFHRSFVYEMHDPPGQVAVLAASAGPEVAIAQSYGFTGVEAIDIAGEIADLVARHYPDAPDNPYLEGGTKRIKADARAAILHSPHTYDIIHMVHANLWSDVGMTANAWSPALLETSEAFGVYLDHLSKGGTISFGRGHHTPALARAASRALRERGYRQPWRQMAYVKKGRGLQVLLIKRDPWTDDDMARLKATAAKYRAQIVWSPRDTLHERALRLFFEGPVMTDDRPYLDEPGLLGEEMKGLLFGSDEEQGTFSAMYYVKRIYRALAVQWFFVIGVGVFLMLFPLLRRGVSGLRAVPHKGRVLMYVACLGYGYLAIEIVLIHELVLYIGHPTYAVTVVVLSMLVSSGLGSFLCERIPFEDISRRLVVILFMVLVLGYIQSTWVPDWLNAHALGWPTLTRFVVTGALLFPLGFLMGMAFPLAMRLLPASAAPVIPWAWALNGWMSVVASLTTIVISRESGYDDAFLVGLGAYLLAWLIAPGLQAVGRTVRYEELPDA